MKNLFNTIRLWFCPVFFVTYKNLNNGLAQSFMRGSSWEVAKMIEEERNRIEREVGGKWRVVSIQRV